MCNNCLSRDKLWLYVAGLAFVVSVGLPILSEASRKGHYSKAQKIAETKVGDERAPLNDLEKTTWYEEMSVKENEEPSRSQLESYISKYSGKGQ